MKYLLLTAVILSGCADKEPAPVVFTESPGQVYDDAYELHQADERVFPMSDLEFSIWMQESSGKEGPILGDGGLSRGPLQCSRAAWKDALEFDPSIGGEYEDVDSIEYALAIFRAYTNRYAIPRRIGEMSLNEAKSRIWNGGPRGHRKSATLNYWAQVKSRL